MQSLCDEEAGTVLLRFFVVLLKGNYFTSDGERIQEGLSREAQGNVPTLG